MGVIRPTVLNPRPGLVLPLLGGWVGALLLSAGIFLAPAFGLPFIDIPHLMGGIFSHSPAVAFWLGFWLNFAAGMFVFPSLLAVTWPKVPGSGVGVLGAAVKGLSFGAGLWVLSGVLLPVAGWLNRLGPGVVQSPGFFAIHTGWLGALAVLGGHLVYGLSVTLIAAMGEGIFPVETLGWPGHRRAETPPAGQLYPDPQLPEHPPIGER
jgi:hypothetical protein